MQLITQHFGTGNCLSPFTIWGILFALRGVLLALRGILFAFFGKMERLAGVLWGGIEGKVEDEMEEKGERIVDELHAFSEPQLLANPVFVERERERERERETLH